MTDKNTLLTKSMILKRMATRMDTVIRDREEEIKRQKILIEEKVALKMK